MDANEPDPFADRAGQLWLCGKCEFDDCTRLEWQRLGGEICLFDDADEPMPIDDEKELTRVRAAVAEICDWSGLELEDQT